MKNIKKITFFTSIFFALAATTIKSMDTNYPYGSSLDAAFSQNAQPDLAISSAPITTTTIATKVFSWKCDACGKALHKDSFEELLSCIEIHLSKTYARVLPKCPGAVLEHDFKTKTLNTLLNNLAMRYPQEVADFRKHTTFFALENNYDDNTELLPVQKKIKLNNSDDGEPVAHNLLPIIAQALKTDTITKPEANTNAQPFSNIKKNPAKFELICPGCQQPIHSSTSIANCNKNFRRHILRAQSCTYKPNKADLEKFMQENIRTIGNPDIVESLDAPIAAKFEIICPRCEENKPTYIKREAKKIIGNAKATNFVNNIHSHYSRTHSEIDWNSEKSVILQSLENAYPGKFQALINKVNPTNNRFTYTCKCKFVLFINSNIVQLFHSIHGHKTSSACKYKMTQNEFDQEKSTILKELKEKYPKDAAKSNLFKDIV